MSGAVLTLAAVAALVTAPDCGGVRADTREGRLLVDRLVATAFQESGVRGTGTVHPFAIRDETTSESLFPATRDEAVRMARERDAAGHVLGLGIFQVTGRQNWAADGITVETAFDACSNVRAGVRHYGRDLTAAIAAMNMASARYNSGLFDGAPGYVRAVAALQSALPSDAGALAVPPPRSLERPAARRVGPVADMALRLPKPVPAAGMPSQPEPIQELASR